MRSNLIHLSKDLAEKCIECSLCRRECAFLANHGNPKEIADRIDLQDDATLIPAYECSLCGLCGAVCPVELAPRDLFLEMRRAAVSKGIAPFPEHKTLLNYERLGTSKRYSYYALPEGCHMVFFPGCGFPGTRPKRTLQVYTHLRSAIPNLGIVLDCCAKPSHDLGREDFFNFLFGEMKDYLVRKGVRTVLTACPNCFRVFKEYGDRLSVRTVYEVLADQGPPANPTTAGKPVVIHDPCATRHEIPVHEAVRTMVRNQGLPVEEMPRHGTKTLCCGEGGAVGLVAPKLAGQWGQKRRAETENRDLVTYCVGCSNLLGKLTPTHHLLDLFFEPEATLQGRVKPAGPPWTYWNRLNLKRKLKKTMKAPVTRERTFSPVSLNRTTIFP
jgi:Fe-S oxidoreductase